MCTHTSCTRPGSCGVVLLELVVSLLPHFTGLHGSVFPTHLATPGQVWWRGAGW